MFSKQYVHVRFDRLIAKLEQSETFSKRNMGTDLLSGPSSSSSSSSALNPTIGGMDKENLTFFVESLKQRRTLKSLAANLKEEVPLVYEALIGERCVIGYYNI
jgi:pheromone shutdown protein TraB